jgi:hypothetical protein
MVRPDLRRDMAASLKYQVLRKEREMWSTQRERLHHKSPQSLVRKLVPRDRSELRPSTRISRK